jgi:hypothetical protein
MKNKLFGLMGVIALFGFGYNTASAVVITTPEYNSSAKAHINQDSDNDPVSSTSSAAWPSPSSGFILSSAEATGLSLESSSAAFVKTAPIPLPTSVSTSSARSKFIIPVEVVTAGFGSLTFSWNGTLDYLTDTAGNSRYGISASTTDNPGAFVSGNPTNSPSFVKTGILGQSTTQDSLVFNDQQQIFWDFEADDVGKIFNVRFETLTSFQINNLDEALSTGAAGELVVGASISANLLFGSNGVLAPVGVTAVPIPAAVWLFGSALLGLFGISKRKVSL